MKKADLRDRGDMWREVAMVRLTQVQGLEEQLVATQRLVAQQATKKGPPGFTYVGTTDGGGEVFATVGPVTGYRVPDLADTAKVGDPDPTVFPGQQRHTDDVCDVVIAPGYTCTRRPGHGVQHVAGGGPGEQVLAVWPVESAELPPSPAAPEVVGTIDAVKVSWSPLDRDRTAAIEGAATTLRAHARVFSLLGTHCTCGWLVAPGAALQEHARHVAEQLAVVGALGDTEPLPHLLVDDNGDTWHVLADGRLIGHRRELHVWDRADVEEKYGPLEAVIHVDNEVPF